MYDNEKYQAWCTQVIECAQGKRGWIAITHAAKDMGTSKGALIQFARAAGLTIDNQSGKHGITAYKA